MAKAKVIKKEWYPILAPKIFQNAVLGETHVYEPGQMVGKSVTKNLMSLTNDVKRQNINIDFEVVNVQNNKAFTDITGYYMDVYFPGSRSTGFRLSRAFLSARSPTSSASISRTFHPRASAQPELSVVVTVTEEWQIVSR